MLANILLYVYIVATFVWFFFHLCNKAFFQTTLKYFLVFTLAICLIEFGSVYSIYWDFARWHGGETWALFPITITAMQSGADPIPKTTFLYWILNITSIAFYVSFPQAVIRGSSLHLAHNKLAVGALRFLAHGYGIGEAFFGIITALSSLVSFQPGTNIWLMLIGYIIIIVTWRSIRGDLLRGFFSHAPAGDHLSTALEKLSNLNEK